MICNLQSRPSQLTSKSFSSSVCRTRLPKTVKTYRLPYFSEKICSFLNISSETKIHQELCTVRALWDSSETPRRSPWWLWHILLPLMECFWHENCLYVTLNMWEWLLSGSYQLQYFLTMFTYCRKFTTRLYWETFIRSLIWESISSYPILCPHLWPRNDATSFMKRWSALLLMKRIMTNSIGQYTHFLKDRSHHEMVNSRYGHDMRVHSYKVSLDLCIRYLFNRNLVDILPKLSYSYCK